LGIHSLFQARKTHWNFQRYPETLSELLAAGKKRAPGTNVQDDGT
jgi:hypothetical protein